MVRATMSTKLRALFLLATTAFATPIGLGQGPANHTLDLRDNPVSCGWNNMYPCAAGQVCYTSNNLPLCANAAKQTAQGANAQGTYQMFTTTYTTEGPIIVTSTYSALVSGPTGGTCAADQIPCNPYLCCASNQWCDITVGNGQCRAYAAAGSPGNSPGLPAVTVTVTTMNGQPTTMTMSISNYVAPTSLSTVTITSSSNTYTTTQALETPVGSSGNSAAGVTATTTSSGGLSAGAIAGIVIGVLAGLFILFIILACLCCKGIFDLLFGKKKKKETETYIHTHHSAHGGSHHSGRPPPRRWFGILPGKADRPDRPEKKDSGLGGLLAIGGILAAVAVFLGLKRRSDKRREEEKSEYSNSVDYYSDYYTETSESSASSDRRTHRTHRSEGRHSRR